MEGLKSLLKVHDLKLVSMTSPAPPSKVKWTNEWIHSRLHRKLCALTFPSGPLLYNFYAKTGSFVSILMHDVKHLMILHPAKQQRAFLPEFCYCWPYVMSSSPLVVDATAVCLFETIWVRIFLKIIKKEFKIGANISVDWTLLQKMKEGRKQGLSNLNPEWQMSVCVVTRNLRLT